MSKGFENFSNRVPSRDKAFNGQGFNEPEHLDSGDELMLARTNYDSAVKAMGEFNKSGGIFRHPIDAFEVNEELKKTLAALKLAQLHHSNKSTLH